MLSSIHSSCVLTNHSLRLGFLFWDISDCSNVVVFVFVANYLYQKVCIEPGIISVVWWGRNVAWKATSRLWVLLVGLSHFVIIWGSIFVNIQYFPPSPRPVFPRPLGRPRTLQRRQWPSQCERPCPQASRTAPGPTVESTGRMVKSAWVVLKTICIELASGIQHIQQSMQVKCITLQSASMPQNAYRNLEILQHTTIEQNYIKRKNISWRKTTL